MPSERLHLPWRKEKKPFDERMNKAASGVRATNVLIDLKC